MAMTRWVGIALILSGCSWVWDATNRQDVAPTLSAVLAARGVPSEVAQCHMVGTTRAFTCTARWTAEEVEAVSASWGLTRAGVEDALLDGRCVGLAARTSSQILVPRGVDPMQGTGLTTFVLVWDAATGEACVGSQFAYG